MSKFLVKCKCANFMSEENFAKHFGRCEEFRKNFKNFDANFGELLKQNSEPKENLLIIRVLLKQYVALLDRKIDNLFHDDVEYSLNREQHHRENRSEKDLIKIDFDPDPRKQIQNPIIAQEPIQYPVIKHQVNPYNEPFMARQEIIIECCHICKDLNFTYLECMHTICLNCFKENARKDFTNMRCILCNEGVSEEFKKMILGEEYEKLENAFIMGCIGEVIECQCGEKINFEKGAVDYNIKNDKNEKLSKNAAEHYAHNRCRCPSCKIDFCVECQMTPYHIGKTCEDQRKFVSAKRCRYDDTVIGNNNRGPAEDVCSSLECEATFKTACTKTLRCGHKCFGCLGEKICPPCLNKDCSKYLNLYGQNSDSFCNICFTEGLGNGPVILLACNHFIHYKCVMTRLSKKWVGPKITFNHCLCPQCNSWLDCPSVPETHKMITENKMLYEDICKKALERLKFEGLNKDSKLTDPNSRWYKNELAYSLNRLSYYLCFECKKPYFAGLRECGEGPNVNNNNPDREYDPKDLICGAHVNNFGVAGMTDCKVHGKEFIEYKCKFCCNIASWFCWGSTHFCEDCHARQCKGDYVSKYARDKLQKCDVSKCPVKLKHPENGEEFGLGCSVCRNNNDNIRNF